MQCTPFTCRCLPEWLELVTRLEGGEAWARLRGPAGRRNPRPRPGPSLLIVLSGAVCGGGAVGVAAGDRSLASPNPSFSFSERLELLVWPGGRKGDWGENSPGATPTLDTGGGAGVWRDKGGVAAGVAGDTAGGRVLPSPASPGGKRAGELVGGGAGAGYPASPTPPSPNIALRSRSSRSRSCSA